MADSDGIVHAGFVERSDGQVAPFQSKDTMDEPTNKILDFSVLDSTRIQEQFKCELTKTLLLVSRNYHSV